MKIAFVNDTFLEGRGADTVMLELAKRLGKTNKIYILAGKTDIKEENFKFIKLDLPKLFTGSISDFSYFKRMKNLHKQITELNGKYSFDKIFVFHGGLSPALKNYNNVIYIWLGSPLTRNILRKLASRYFKGQMKKNKIITISKYLNQELKKIGAKKTRVILLGVSEEFKPTNKDEEYMLYVGRLEKHKEVQELIRLSGDIDFKLKVAGYGPEDKKLRILANKLNAPVEFLGRVSRKELIELYRECSFFVSASKWEGFGLIFIEAGACAKTSIGYNAGSIPEVIINNKTGFLVNSYSEFQKKAKLLKESKNLRKKLGKNALKFSKKFNWNIVSKEYLKKF